MNLKEAFNWEFVHSRFVISKKTERKSLNWKILIKVIAAEINLHLNGSA